MLCAAPMLSLLKVTLLTAAAVACAFFAEDLLAERWSGTEVLVGSLLAGVAVACALGALRAAASWLRRG